MGEKVFHTLSITGFEDERARRNFQERAHRVLSCEMAEKSDLPEVAFSLETLLPLGPPEDFVRNRDEAYRQRYPREASSPHRVSPIDLEVRWGYPVIEEGENVNNRGETFTVQDFCDYRENQDSRESRESRRSRESRENRGESFLGLFYTFESFDGPVHRALRILSRQNPELLWRVYTREENGYQTYALYRRGRRFLLCMDDSEYELSRAGEWPMIRALSPAFSSDPELHALAQRFGEEGQEDTGLEEELQQQREELEREWRESPSS